MKTYSTIASDTFLCKEIHKGFKTIDGLDMREYEGNTYTNFSNVVEITSVANKSNSHNLSVGDVVLCHHRVVDSPILEAGAAVEGAEDEAIYLLYSEDILARSSQASLSGKESSEPTIEDFTAYEDYIICEEVIPEDGLTETSRNYSRYLETGELVSYMIHSDYEVILKGKRYFVIKKEYVLDEAINYKAFPYNERMIITPGQVWTNDIDGSEWVMMDDILGLMSERALAAGKDKFVKEFLDKFEKK